MRNEKAIVDEQEINTIGGVMNYLSDSVNKVSTDVDNINLQVDEFQKQINDMQNNVMSLEDEVREFMKEIKKSVLVNNAKQSIMISQMEYEKKYSHRDEVRRRITGILQSVDINILKKETMETVGEETIVNNPDYWLAPALVALCYWYTGNKKMASTALKKALDRSDEKTSFLFCLIHLRANRIKTAIKWLNRYLSFQDPTNMDCKIVLLLDALTSKVFDEETTKIILDKIELWMLKLNEYPQYEIKQIDRWEDYFRKNEIPYTNENKYIDNFVEESTTINNITHYSDFHIHMLKHFDEKLNNENYSNNNQVDKIDKLVNMLIYDYEEEELKIKQEIQKSNTIIENNGLQNENYNYNENNYNKVDFYTHITNICLNDNVFDIGITTKKMAIALSKGLIIKAYQRLCDTNYNIVPLNLNINIETWHGNTKDGSNEEMLKEDLNKHVENEFKEEINFKNFVSKEMIISIFLTIAMSFIIYKNAILLICLILLSLAFNIYIIYNKYKSIKNKTKQMNEKKYRNKNILMAILAEIVDYHFIYEKSKLKQEEFIKYILSLNYKDFIQTNKINGRRDIIIDERN